MSIQPELGPQNPEEVFAQSRFSRLAMIAKRSAQTAIIAAEILPVNETLRYSAFAASQILSSDPLVGALVYGGSTFVIEASAALASASALDTISAKNALGWVNNKLEKAVPKDTKMPLTVEAGVAILGGSVIVMAAKQREDPDRTIEQNRKYGLFTSSWLAGVCAVQGALMSEGIHNPGPETIGAALLAVGGVMAAANWIKKRFSRTQRKNLQTQD